MFQKNVGYLIESETALREIVSSCLKSEILPIISELKKTPVDDDALFTRQEAAEFLKISTTQLYYLQKRGIIKYYRIGSKVLFKKKDLINSLKVGTPIRA